ncbi:DUF2182 domain-containing protein [Pseudooctadecabacter jejudonensis]|uniref:Metal-binding integral membrane protein n=1 Tax=Pseudooctadecabacter jejudonensis TaxID=1391910 RepID=A0A1Y5RCW5_9RHOB|nr:DUF2182 domain-containing protein [Pseudooctadecabacter jejudonensis]SLN14161.1 hypothetical protein PSJ8397_00254 [Pseudooctadecabacter jejudonensis]
MTTRVTSLLNARSVLWLAFFAAIVLAWAVMYMMAIMSGLDLIGRPVGENMMPMVTFGVLFPMWAIMMAAMMLPTLVPTLRSYEDLMVSANGTRAGWTGVLLGYFIVWVGFAALISVVQVGLIAAGAIDALGIAHSALLAGALLIAVGAYQFTRAKEICHGVCHSPMMYFVGHWRTGFGGGLRMGLGLGAFCVGCCWGFMALGFVGGVMSLLWMGLATVFMILEKVPSIGHVITKPAGVVLIAAGIVLPVWAYL